MKLSIARLSIILFASIFVFAVIPNSVYADGRFGTSGGEGGNLCVALLDDKYDMDEYILAELHVWSGSLIDAIQPFYLKKDDIGKGNRPLVPGKRCGGPGGRKEVLVLDSDEYIMRIEGRYGLLVDSLHVETNKGSTAGFGGKNGEVVYQYGGGRTEIIGFVTFAGQYVDSIGVVTRNGTTGWYGPAGGMGGGGYFRLHPDIVNPHIEIVEVWIWSGQYIDAIQLLYADPLNNHCTRKTPCTTSTIGGRGGELKKLKLGEGEYITRIYGWRGVYIDNITIEYMNRNREGKLEPDTKSWGGDGGAIPFVFPIPNADTNSFIGFWGKSGDFIDSIGVILQ